MKWYLSFIKLFILEASICNREIIAFKEILGNMKFTEQENRMKGGEGDA